MNYLDRLQSMSVALSITICMLIVALVTGTLIVRRLPNLNEFKKLWHECIPGMVICLVVFSIAQIVISQRISYLGG